MIIRLLGEIVGLACFWSVFLVITSIPSVLVIFLGRRRAQWRLWELSAFVLPYWTWAACNLIDSSGKSLSNVAVELMWLAIAVPAAAIIRIAVGPRKWRWHLSAVLIGVLCCLAICLWAFVPPLPE